MLDFHPLYEMVGTSADEDLRISVFMMVGHGDPSSYQVIENSENFFLKKFDCLKMFENVEQKMARKIFVQGRFNTSIKTI